MVIALYGYQRPEIVSAWERAPWAVSAWERAPWACVSACGVGARALHVR